MIRKIIASILLGILSFSLVGQGFAYEEFSWEGYYEQMRTYYEERLEEASTDLLTLSNGVQYKKQLDIFFKMHGENEDIMNKLDERLWDIEDKIYFEGADRKTEIVIAYLRAKLNIALNDIYIAEEKRAAELKAQKVQEVTASTITASEKRVAEREILKLQENMLNYGNDAIEKMLGDLEQYTKVQENGDFSMNMSIADGSPIFGESVSGDLSFKIENYESKSDVFDSQFNGDISVNLSALADEEEVEMSGKAYFDMIQKDGVMYLSISDAEVAVSGPEVADFTEVQDMIETINEYGKQEKYIRIGNEETAQYSAEVFANLRNLSPDKLFGSLKVATEIAFFEAYKKQGNTYSLIPTQHLCSTLKDMAGKFDPFNGGACSDKQYNDFLADYLDMGGELTLTIEGTQNTLRYAGEESDTTYFIQAVYNSTEISSITAEVTPDQSDYPGEGLKFAYNKGKEITFWLMADEALVTLDTVLTTKNQVYSVDASIVYEDAEIAYLNVAKNQVSAGIDYTIEGYDWNTGDYIEKATLLVNADGTWNGQGFDTLNVDGKYTDLRDRGDYSTFSLTYGEESATSIDSELVVVESNQELFLMSVNGNMEKDFADILVEITLEEFPTGDMVFDIMYDLRDNKANADIYANIEIGDKEFLKLDMNNTGTRVPFDGEIVAPENYIDLDEVLDQEMYY